VYISAAELVDLEQARLALRRYGYVLDRGRLVREAIAILLADLDARGKDSLVARRVRAGTDPEMDGIVVSQNGAGQNGSGPGAAVDDPDDAASPIPSLSWQHVRAAR
jgi:hypothetical protein